MTEGPVQCRAEPRSVVVERPVEECQMSPVRVCRPVTRMVPRLEPTQAGFPFIISASLTLTLTPGLYGCSQGDLLPVKDQPQEGEEAGHQESLHEEDFPSFPPTITTSNVTTSNITNTIIVQ